MSNETARASWFGPSCSDQRTDPATSPPNNPSAYARARDEARAFWFRSASPDRGSTPAASALDAERQRHRDFWMKSAQSGQRSDAAPPPVDPLWQRPRLTPVQEVLPMAPPLPPGPGPSTADPAIDAAARQLQHLFDRARTGLELGTREGLAELDTLARAATALDGRSNTFEYRAQLKNDVEKKLDLQGDSLSTENQNRNENDRLEVHHTVPYAAPRAQIARDILQKWNISINDPANAAILPHSFHRGPQVHGASDDGYSQDVVRSLRAGDRQATRDAAMEGRTVGREEMFEELRRQSDDLVRRSGDERAMALEAVLRAAERQMPRPEVLTARSGPRLGR